MSSDRREHVRYKPTVPLSALLLWQDQMGAQKSSVQLNDVSQGGCSLISLEAPPVGEHVVIVLTLNEAAPPLQLECQVLSRNPRENALQTSMRFEQITAEQVALMVSILETAAFEPIHPDPHSTSRKHWRVPQWAAFLTAQQLPVMPRSKQGLLALEEEKGNEMTANHLVILADGDPFLCLNLLREAENRRSARLGHETSTPLAAVMQLGVKGFRELLLSSPETDDTRSGLARCEARAVMAGQMAAAWSKSRADVSPDEVLMAALLSEIGELLLWHFAPDLPQAALQALASGDVKRSTAAQEAVCGFKFKDLTLKCAEIWTLPNIIVQMIRGHDTTRANLARLSRNTARHLISGPDNPALPDDIAAAKRLLPHASVEWLVEQLPWVPVEMRQDLVDKANLALVSHPPEAP